MRRSAWSAAEVSFATEKRKEVYSWVNETLRQQDYERLGRRAKGLVRRYVAKMTGLSRAQTTRLIGPYLEGEAVALHSYRRRRFPVRYTPADIALLAEVDEAHDTLSGPATRKILYRAWHDFGFQHRQQPGFADARSRSHDLPLRDFIDRVDVVNALGRVSPWWTVSTRK